MKKRLPFLWLVFLGAFFVSCSVSVEGIDLTKYQGFMQPKLGRAKPPRQIPPKKIEEVIPPQEIKDIVTSDADASFKGAKLMTLPSPKKDLESLSLPPETRIPEALRPLLSERKNPRQGVSLNGLTGSLLVPSPGVLEPNKSSLAVHGMTFDLFDVNDNKYQDQDYFDTSVKMTFGAMEGLEVGFDKTFSNQDRFGIPEPVYVNAKYQVPGNVTLGGNFCSSGDGYSSVWVCAGVPAVWVGTGINFGPGKYRFFFNGYDHFKRAKLGGYNYDYNKAEGYADPAYFFVGGNCPISKSTHFVYDFNGDKFSLGLRLNYRKIVFFDASYISDGDYERLPGAISHKKLNNFVFGGSIVF